MVRLNQLDLDRIEKKSRKKGVKFQLFFNAYRCIQKGHCGVPLCEHGVYLMDVGKCPTKKEKMEEYSRVELKLGWEKA